MNNNIEFRIDLLLILERILEAFSVPKRMKLALISVGHAPLKIAVDGGRVRQRCKPPAARTKKPARIWCKNRKSHARSVSGTSDRRQIVLSRLHYILQWINYHLTFHFP